MASYVVLWLDWDVGFWGGNNTRNKVIFNTAYQGDRLQTGLILNMLTLIT
jgi:hypothetical protein